MNDDGTLGTGPDHDPGTFVAGRYRLQRQLGRGGMGVVWEALDTGLGRKVAVKGLLHPGAVTPGTQTQWVSRARREAQAIARIGHQNVVAVHDVIEDGNQVWIVMELVSSRSLADLLREQRQLVVPHAARIGLQVLRGLMAVHDAGVLHRDVKPHNILFRPDGRALLMDFGISTFEGAVQVTRSHEIMGTPAYLAPELVSRAGTQSRPATTASDLWAFGVTLYEMVEGRRPFGGATGHEIAAAVRKSRVPAMEYAGPLTSLIESLLRKDPSRRPHAAEVEKVLQGVAGDSPALDTPPVPKSDEHRSGTGLPPVLRVRSRKPVRWGVPAIVLCTAVLAGGGGFLRGMSDRDGDVPDTATDKPTTKGGPAVPGGYRHTHPELKIGVKEDQPGLSEERPGGRKGFEVSLAEEIAQSMGYGADEFHFVNVTSDNRDSLLKSGHVDIVLATYSITEKRKSQGIDFAGPYYEAHRSLLVRKDRNYKDISNLQDDSSAEVCTVRGSTYEDWIVEEGLTPKNHFPAKYKDCVAALLDSGNRVYAVATDDVIVAGYAREYPGTQRLDSLDGSEPYGVAMLPGQKVLKAEVCGALSKIMKGAGNNSRWARMYEKHLFPLLGEPAPNEPQLKECNGFS
jgi:eukaryotic-like serine/threonine-protein kinase